MHCNFGGTCGFGDISSGVSICTQVRQKTWYRGQSKCQKITACSSAGIRRCCGVFGYPCGWLGAHDIDAERNIDMGIVGYDGDDDYRNLG